MTAVPSPQDQVLYVKGLIQAGLPIMPASVEGNIHYGKAVPMTDHEAENHYRDPFAPHGVAVLLGEKWGYHAIRFKEETDAEAWMQKDPSAKDLASFVDEEGVAVLGPLGDPVLEAGRSAPGAADVKGKQIRVPSHDDDPKRRWRNAPKPKSAVVPEQGVDDGTSQTIVTPTIDGLHAIRGPEYLKKAGPFRRRWVVKDFLPLGYMVLWSGGSKEGKSTMLTDLAVAVASGRSWLGFDVVQGNVLWMALEESHQERAEILQLHQSLPNGLFVCHQPIHFNAEKDLALIERFVREHDIKLIVADPLYAAVHAESLVDGKTARNAVHPIKLLLNRLGVTLIFVHHITKAVKLGMVRERAADSGQLLATSSMDVLMETRINADRTRQIFLRCKGRGDFANNTYIVHSKGATEYELVESGASGSLEMNNLPKAIVDHLKSIAPKEETGDEIAEALVMNVRSVKNALSELQKAKKIKVDKEGKTYKYSI